VILNAVLPLIGVLIGAGATIAVQRSSAREARQRAVAEARQAKRTEIKSAIASYLEVAQRLQHALYERKHGREVPDIPAMVGELWVAHAQVDILCSDGLREALVRHAEALNAVGLHEGRHPDFWEYVRPYKNALLDAVRDELKWPESVASAPSPEVSGAIRAVLSSGASAQAAQQMTKRRESQT
jgi:hypothetical protein